MKTSRIEYPFEIRPLSRDEGGGYSIALLIMDNLGHLGAPSAIIEDVAVDPSLQSKGIGKEMMRYAIQLAADYGCYKAVLSSNLKCERAHAFYKSLDFEEHGYGFRIDARQTAGTGGAKKHAAAQPAVRRHHEH